MTERLWFLFAFLGTLYGALFLIERKWPLRPVRHQTLKRILVNASMSGLAFGTSALLVQPAVAAMLRSGDSSSAGLVKLNELHWSLELLAALLLFDLSFYYWHRLNHSWPFLWRFHNVHHVDPDLDVSSGFRFHPGEIALSTGFRAVQIGSLVAVLGVNVWTFAIYEALFQAATLFHHSNVRLPSGFERVLNLVFVTPRMHGLHHSIVREETNSNYSVVFSFWDRLHRSLSPLTLKQKEIGVPGYRRPNDNTVSVLLAMPFRKQRPYWNPPDSL
jgi:sterol desaturase/sphingolipid hydroxylase (fatty acid hydroxylase superfamily)